MTTINGELVLPLVEPYLRRQGWFETAIAGRATATLEISSFDVLVDSIPGLGRLLLERGEQSFQVLIGWRLPGELAGALRYREAALMGTVGSDVDQLIVYDALADDVLCLKLLEIATDGQQTAERVRAVSTLTSHASLVFDDRLFMKCYRVLEVGERTEVETTVRLDQVGFNALPGPFGRLRAHNFDLAFVREFLPGALEGRALALTSLRDILAYAGDDDVLPSGIRSLGARVDRHDPVGAVAAAGGDLASESFRLGQTIARLHIALREAFGDSIVDLTSLITQLERAAAETDGEPAPSHSRVQLVSGELDAPVLLQAITRFQGGDLGHAIRLHGELHLRRVMRSEIGWIVTGFADDPLYRPLSHGSSMAPRIGSPIEDLADMFFSIELVAIEALSQRPSPEAPDAIALARAWVTRNQESFLRGYLSTPGVNAILPSEHRFTETLLAGYRLRRRRRFDASFDGSDRRGRHDATFAD